MASPEELLEKLFVAAENAQPSSPHCVAAYNALCAYLNQGCAQNEEHRAIKANSVSEASRDRLLGLYLQRPQDPNSKIKKQVLATWAQLIRASSTPEQTTVKLLDKPLTECRHIIIDSTDWSKVKSAMHVNLYALTKKLITSVDFVDEPCSNPRTGTRLQMHLNQTRRIKIQTWLDHLLRWSAQYDLAPTAGKLLFEMLHPLSPEQRSSEGEIPIWRDALLRWIDNEVGSEEAIQRYTLPYLLQVNAGETLQFIQSLSLAQLISGLISTVPEKEAWLCLIAMKTAVKNKIDIEIGKEVVSLWGRFFT